jgi:hypothetical protein
MKPPKFGSIKPRPASPVALNYDREERAAIHEFDGDCTRAEAEARAAAECQHCGHVKPLEPVNKASYGHGLDVCAKCAVELVAKGWTLGKSYVEGKVW